MKEPNCPFLVKLEFLFACISTWGLSVGLRLLMSLESSESVDLQAEVCLYLSVAVICAVC